MARDGESTYRDVELQVGEAFGAGFHVRLLASPFGEAQGLWVPVEGADPFAGLWQGEVGEVLRLSVRAAPVHRLRFRIRFHVDGADLLRVASLPWEQLAPPGGSSLALDPRTPVVRQLEVGVPLAEPEVGDETFRVVLVAAGPPGQARLDLHRERAAIEEAWAGRSEVEVAAVQAATLADLRRALQDRPCHVLHFAGHGDAPGGGEEGKLVFEGPDGSAERVAASDFSIKLQGVRGLQLVVLNACDSAAVRGSHPFLAVAPHLIRVGVPAVVAMRTAVLDRDALVFSHALHDRLAAGDRLEEAVAEGRQAIHSRQPSERGWTVPALFTRSGFPGLVVPRRTGVPDRRLLLDRYAHWLELENRSVSLAAFGPPGAAVAVPLDRIFVSVGALPPLASPSSSPSAAEPPPSPAPGEGEPIAPSLADVLHRGPAGVVFGGTGSGKTTLLRWLARRMAGAWLRGVDRLRVPAPEVDPTASGGHLDLGPVRLPVLVRLADFARARRRDPSLTLAAWSGFHLGDGNGRRLHTPAGEEIDPALLNRAFLDLARAGRLLVLLDGLDQIHDAAERVETARQVARFVEVFGSAKGEGSGFYAAGCRLLVTARPSLDRQGLFPPWMHRWKLGVLGPEAVRGLCEAVEAVLGPVPGSLHQRVVPSLGSHRGGLPPVPATVVLLATSLGTESPPDRSCVLRARLLTRWIEGWRRQREEEGREVPPERKVVEQLAGLVAGRWRGGGGGADWLGKLDGVTPETPGAALAWDLGLADRQGRFEVPRVEDHLAARWLLLVRERVVERFLAVLADERWRRAVLEAFGLISGAAPRDFELLALQLLEEPDPPACPVPRVALALVAALPELAVLPPRLAEAVAGALLGRRAVRGLRSGAPEVDRSLERAFLDLADGEPEGAREGAVRALVRCLDDGGGAEVGAAALLARQVDRWNADLVEALGRAVDRDPPEWGWPVDAALRRAARVEPALLPAPGPDLRSVLRREPETRCGVSGEVARTAVVLALYGGLDGTAGGRREPGVRGAAGVVLPGPAAPAGACGPGGTLDQESLHRESPLTPRLLPWLRGEEGEEAVVDRLRQACSEGLPAAERADAEVALVALGRRLDGEPSRRGADRLALLARRLAPVLAAGVPVDELEPHAPPEGVPALLAEAWHDLAADVSPDGLYRACVRLDAEGRLLSDPPRRLVEALVAAHRSPRAGRTPWRLDPCDALAADRGEGADLAVALDALAALPESLDFVRGWGLRRLAAEGVAGGFGPELLILALGALSDRFEGRRRTLRHLLRLAPDLGPSGAGSSAGDWLLEADVGAALLERVRATTPGRASLPPGHRERCLRALGRWFPGLRPLLPAGAAGPGASREVPPRTAPGLYAPPVEALVAAVLPPPRAARLLLASRVAAVVATAPDAVAGAASGGTAEAVPGRRGGGAVVFSAGAAGVLDAESVRRCVGVLRDSFGAPRHRAALTLLGEGPAGRVRWSATRVGAETVETLARCWIEESEGSPVVAKIIERAFERIHHDHGAAFEGWLQAAEADRGEATEVARVILARLDRLAPSVWLRFLDGLAHGSTSLRRPLLRSLCWMAVRGRVPEDWWPPALEVLRRSDFVAPGYERFLLDGPLALAEAAEGALADAAPTSVRERVGRAEERLLALEVGWPRILEADDPQLREMLARIGSLHLDSPRYEGQVRRAAGRLQRHGGAVALLAAWVEERLKTPRPAPGREPWVTGDLLRLAAELAEDAPADWSRATRSHLLLEKLLSEAAWSHGTTVGRSSALLLLGRLHRITDRVVRALRSGLRDVAEVREAVLRASHRFREAEPVLLGDLVDDLDHPDPEVAAVAARLLHGLALNPTLHGSHRCEAVQALVAAATAPGAKRRRVALVRVAGRFGEPLYRLHRHGPLADLYGGLLAEVRGDLVFAPGPGGGEG